MTVEAINGTIEMIALLSIAAIEIFLALDASGVGNKPLVTLYTVICRGREKNDARAAH